MHRSIGFSRALFAAALVVGVGAVGVGTASAAVAAPVSIVASVTCDTATNNHVITWTVTNLTQETVDNNGGVLVDTKLTVGHTLDLFIRFFPGTMVGAGAISVGTSRADGNALGVIDLTLTVFPRTSDTFIQVPASVTITDTCGAAAPSPAPTTTAPTTTVPATTTTAVASQAPAATAVSASDGTLPRTGGGTPLALPALLAVLLGLGLTLTFRRPKHVSYAVPARRVGRSN